MKKSTIFIIRIALGALFAVLLSRVFYPNSGIIFAAALGIVLVGLAYLVEFFRNRKNKRE